MQLDKPTTVLGPDEFNLVFKHLCVRDRRHVLFGGKRYRVASVWDRTDYVIVMLLRLGQPNRPLIAFFRVDDVGYMVRANASKADGGTYDNTFKTKGARLRLAKLVRELV